MIDSYTSLKTAVEKWLDRDDEDIVERIPEFIQLAEATIRRRVRRKTIRTSLVVSQESTAMPSDCVELRSIYPRTSVYSKDKPLDIVTPEQLITIRAQSAPSGRPRAASLVGGQILLAPTPDQSYTLEIIYYEKLSPLSTSNNTNSVLIESPDVYLFGALAEAEPYVKNDDRVALWKSKFDGAVDEIDKARTAEEYNASLRKARLPTVFT